MKCIFCNNELKNIPNGSNNYHAECLESEKNNNNNKAKAVDLSFSHNDNILFIEKNNELSSSTSEIIKDIVLYMTSYFGVYPEHLVVKNSDTNIYEAIKLNDAGDFDAVPLSNVECSEVEAVRLYKKKYIG